MLLESDYTTNLWGDAGHTIFMPQTFEYLPLTFEDPVTLDADGGANMLGLFGLEEPKMSESAGNGGESTVIEGFDPTSGSKVAITQAGIPMSYKNTAPPISYGIERAPLQVQTRTHGHRYKSHLDLSCLSQAVPRHQPALPQSSCFNAQVEHPNRYNAKPFASAASHNTISTEAAVMQGQIDELLAFLETRAPAILQQPSAPPILKTGTYALPGNPSVIPVTPKRPSSALRLPGDRKAEIEVVDLTASPPPPSVSFPSPSKGGGSRPDWRLAEILSKRRPAPNQSGTPSSSPRKRKAHDDDDGDMGNYQESPTKRKKPSSSEEEQFPPYAPAATVSMTPNGKGRAPAFDLSRKVVQAFKAQKAERMSRDVTFLSGPASLKAERDRIKAVTETESASISVGMGMGMGTSPEDDTFTSAPRNVAPLGSTVGSDTSSVASTGVRAGSNTFNMDLGCALPPMSTSNSMATNSTDEYGDDCQPPPPPPVLNDDWIFQLLGISSLDVPHTENSGHGSDEIFDYEHINRNPSQSELGSQLFQSQYSQSHPSGMVTAAGDHDGGCVMTYDRLDAFKETSVPVSSSLDLSSWLMDS
ncbi:hypothetical protein FRB96_005986 [Tulasnella sp. 330]|nr:hypothetical protein FRB96_005986 [Tulasnella sp. 330]